MADSPIADRGGWLLAATRRLTAAGVDAPRLCAELLLCHVQGVSRTTLIIHPEALLAPDALPALETLLARRESGEPMAHLLGERDFYGRPFMVSSDTLIPRPETEHLVELALDRCPDSPLIFVDLGTGSGCIAVTLCAERPSWRGLAADRSWAALAVARHNARQLGVSERLAFAQADFCHPLVRQCDLVVSNPPYIPLAEYRELDPGVRLFEPRSALTPGPSGLEHLEAIIRQAGCCLREGGCVLLEHAHDQGEAVRLLLKNNFWEKVFTFSDFSGHERITGAQRSGSFTAV